MEIEKVFICSDNTDHFFKTTSGSELYRTIWEFREVSKSVSTEGNSAQDLLLAGSALPQFERFVKERLEEKLNGLGKGKDPSHEITVLGRTIKIDLRNDEHKFVHSLNSMLQIIDIEQKVQGAIHCYNISSIQNSDAYILMFVKKQATALTLEDYYAGFIAQYPDQQILYPEFALRTQKLVLEGFINESRINGQLLYTPSHKTTRIYF